MHSHRDGRRVLYQTVASTLLNNPQFLTTDHRGIDITNLDGPGAEPMPRAEIALLTAAVLGLFQLAQTS